MDDKLCFSRAVRLTNRSHWYEVFVRMLNNIADVVAAICQAHSVKSAFRSLSTITGWSQFPIIYALRTSLCVSTRAGREIQSQSVNLCVYLEESSIHYDRLCSPDRAGSEGLAKLLVAVVMYVKMYRFPYEKNVVWYFRTSVASVKNQILIGKTIRPCDFHEKLPGPVLRRCWNVGEVW